MNTGASSGEFFQPAQRIEANPRGNVAGQEMFSDVRCFAFDDSEHGWLTTEQGSFGISGPEFWRVRSSGHAIELSEAGRSTLLVPVAGRVDVQTRNSTFGAGTGEFLFFSPNHRTTHVSARAGQPYEALVVMGDLQPALRGHGDVAIAAKCNPGFSAYLKYVLSSFASAAVSLNERARNAAGVLLLEHIDQMLQGLTPDEQGAATGRQTVRKAEEIMAARFGEPLPITEIARFVGVSERSLQLAFREHLGLTPTQSLNRFRLNAVRERLLSPGPNDTVSSVALDCGFTHLGRFAAVYRAEFGEHPSLTLKSGAAGFSRMTRR